MPCGSVTREFLLYVASIVIAIYGLYVLDICCGIGIEAVRLWFCTVRLARHSVDSSPMSAKPNVEGGLQVFELGMNIFRESFQPIQCYLIRHLP
jgi:hypothetical protein